MSQLKLDSGWVQTQEDMEDAFHHFFVQLSGRPASRHHTLDLNAIEVSTADLAQLEAQFTEQEIWEAIKSMPPDKAPGPDGFSVLFYQTCWDIIKGDLVTAFLHFGSSGGHNFHQLNQALIILVPKKPAAEEPKDFRPISLLHSFAKLVSKVLARRLSPCLASVVAPNQSAFIKHRSMQDNFNLVRLSARTLHQRKKPSLLLKLDIAHAFDSISWPFLLEVLTHKGFGPSWCRWIAALLSTSSSRVLLNGWPGKPIRHGRGVRQGDPLSPMLFVLAMDILNNLIHSAENSSLLAPVGGLRGIPHRLFLYADDAALFLTPVVTDLITIKEILQLFGEALGLHSNLAKSSLSPIRCSELHLQLIEEVLPCPRKDFPCKYLGLPLSLRKTTKGDFQPLLDKIASRLASWKARLLSTGGRVVLIKSVITATPIYHLMALEPPVWILKQIDKRRRAFLWKGAESISGGACLVDWSSVCRPVEYRGLGILNLRLLGSALRLRWLWFQRSWSSRPWQGLCWSANKTEQDLFQNSISVRLGNSEDYLFWSDKWLDGRSIPSLAPSLVASIPCSIKRSRSVAAGLSNRAWVSDIVGDMDLQALAEFLRLWELL